MELNIETIKIFDFDGTLTTETWPKYWVWVNKFGYKGETRNDELERAIAEYRATHKGDKLETFFGFFNNLLVSNKKNLSYEELMQGEKYIIYNPGVRDFLEKSPSNNYIVSGGLKEFLQKLEIAHYFDDIYGTPVIHNQDGLISGIGEAVTDDKKILAIKDILKRNNRKENDCRNVYYIGDGYSDKIAMRFVHNNGGKAVFVHQPDQTDGLYDQSKEIYEKLKKDGIVDFYCLADYNNGKDLSNVLLGK